MEPRNPSAPTPQSSEGQLLLPPLLFLLLVLVLLPHLPLCLLLLLLLLFLLLCFFFFFLFLLLRQLFPVIVYYNVLGPGTQDSLMRPLRLHELRKIGYSAFVCGCVDL